MACFEHNASNHEHSLRVPQHFARTFALGPGRNFTLHWPAIAPPAGLLSQNNFFEQNAANQACINVKAQRGHASLFTLRPVLGGALLLVCFGLFDLPSSLYSL